MLRRVVFSHGERPVHLVIPREYWTLHSPVDDEAAFSVVIGPQISSRSLHDHDYQTTKRGIITTLGRPSNTKELPFSVPRL